MKANDLPLIPPVRVEVAAGTTRVISFPNEFFGSAVAIRIKNNDAANAATFRTGGDSQPLVNVAPSQAENVDDTIINLLEVTAGAAGTVTVSAQVLLDPRAKEPKPEQVI